GNGIGDSSFGRDKYPLIKPMENYGSVQATPTPSPSLASTSSSINENISTATASQRALTPGFEGISAMLGLLSATVVAATLKRRAN
ncbi:MAG TPA: hypothetical protein VF393_02260, partial [archaeon]